MSTAARSYRRCRLGHTRDAGIERRLAELAAWQKMRAGPVAARRFRKDEAVPWTVGSVGPAIANFDRLFDKMVEVLERVFEPLDLGQRAGHLDADLEESVAQRNGNAQFRGKPTDAHHIGDLTMHIEDVGAAD